MLAPLTEWTPKMEAHLRAVVDRRPQPPLNWYREAWGGGDLEALAYRDNRGDHVCTVLYRLERTHAGREFVIVATGGDNGGGIIEAGYGEVEALARSLDADAVRLHTDRKGLERIMEQHGFQYQEAVMRKDLD